MFEEEYKAAFSKVTASGDTLSNILNYESGHTVKRSRVGYFVLVAVILTLMAACTAVVFDSNAMLEAAFGENGRAEYEYEEVNYKKNIGKISGRFVEAGIRYALDEKTASKLLAPYIVETDVTIRDSGNTLTIQAYLHDPVTRSGILYMHMENPEGFPNVHIWTNGQVSWLDDNNAETYYLDTSGLNLFYIVEGTQGETGMDLICSYTLVEEENSIRVFFRDSDEEAVIELPEETAMERLVLEGGDIVVTPISLRLNSNRFSVDIMDDPNVKIRYADETEMVVEKNETRKNTHYYSRFRVSSRTQPVRNYYSKTDWPLGDSSAEKRYLLQFAVDIENIQSIIINDEEFPVQ